MRRSQLVKEIKAQGKDHLIIEDLGTFAKSFCKSDMYEGFKYSRLIKMMNLSDIKNILTSICNKNNVQLTCVQSHYTSQQCSKCGHISRDNRKSQEAFECVECGHRYNADFNAALNILNRFVSDVLKLQLLNKTSLGTYVPKKLKKEFIKTLLKNHTV